MKLSGQPLITAFSIAIFTLGSAGSSFAQETPPAPKVSVAAAYSDEITADVKFIGRGSAIDKVDIMARVTGFLEDVTVEDGAPVKEGDILFHIESGNYDATLSAREADKLSAIANLKLSEIELERKTELFRRQAGTEADRDIAQANNQVAQAQVEIADAAIDLAKLDVSYTSVVAPFDGRIGSTNASIGELVGPATAPLVTLVRISPMYVEFSLSEKQLANISEKYGSEEKNVANNPATPDVYVTLANGTELEEAGRLVFADNRIDPATGTIKVRAQFDNKLGLILDGSYMSLRIEETEPTKVVLIPQAAVQRDQRGDFVLVVGAEQNVEQRYVTLGRQVEIAVVVEDGLREGETVIVEGLQRVRPGVSVDAVLAGSSPEAEGN